MKPPILRQEKKFREHNALPNDHINLGTVMEIIDFIINDASLQYAKLHGALGLWIIASYLIWKYDLGGYL